MPLFDYKTVPVGSDAPVQLFAGSTRRARMYALVTAHPTNTAPIYVGSSPQVSADPAEPTAGDPLGPGQSKTIPINISIEGQTQHDIYAIAEEGEQFAYCELQ